MKTKLLLLVGLCLCCVGGGVGEQTTKAQSTTNPRPNADADHVHPSIDVVEQGRINLDDKIARWLPDLLAADQVTMRMLVSNTAGYIDYVRVKDFLDLQLAEPFRTFTDEELIKYSVRDGKMNFPPGTSQQYSHTDNVILGQVIQRATAQSMKELYDANIFGPLGMKDTQFPVNQEIQSPVLHAFTMDRKFYEDCTYWNPFWGSTPGLPTSNLHDLGEWGPILGTGRLISPAHFREQIAPTSVGKGQNRPDLYFAYGLSLPMAGSHRTPVLTATAAHLATIWPPALPS
jgi:CubicO group peptidase (beta-lactamase class C family)